MPGPCFPILPWRLPVRSVLAGLLAVGLWAPASQARALDDIERQLARLTSEQAAERWRAERWLATHLSTEHLPVLAEAALAGGSEVQGRLVRALSADDRHMGLGVLLLTDPREEIAGLGQRALEELLLVWSASALDVSLKEGRWPPALDPGWRGYLLEPRRGGLHSVIDRIGRWGRGPIPLILDPSLDPGVAGELTRHPMRPRRYSDQGPFLGTWTEGLRGTLDTHGVSGSVLGWRGTEKTSSEGTHPFLLIHKKGRSPATAAEHILEWCRGVLRPHDAGWNAASARSLGALGWPAALGWLEERWFAGDRAALEGLLVAARARRFAPGLLDAERLAQLVQEATRGLQIERPAARRFLEDLARALADLPLAAAQEARLSRALLEQTEPLDPASRWLRLVIWEGQRPGNQAVRARCREWLQESTSPPLQWQALRTLGALGATVHELPPAASMSKSLEWAEHQGALDLYIRDLIAVRVRPASWAPDFRATPAHRLAYLHWCVGVSDRSRAAQTLAALLDEWDPVQLALHCRLWQGSGLAGELEALVRGPELAAALGQQADPGSPQARLLLHAGLARPGERAAVWARWAVLAQTGEKPNRAQLEDLAALVADAPPRGGRALAALLEAAKGQAAPEDTGAATVVAGRVLVWAGWGPEAQNLRDEVQRAMTLSGTDLSEVLHAPDWPTGAAPRLRLLWIRDRHLEIQGP